MSNSDVEDQELLDPPAGTRPKPTSAADWGISDATEGTAIKRVPAPELAYQRDQKFFRTALHYIGGIAVLTIVGSLALEFFDKEIPQFLVAIGSGALGLFGAMFGVSRR